MATPEFFQNPFVQSVLGGLVAAAVFLWNAGRPFGRSEARLRNLTRAVERLDAEQHELQRTVGDIKALLAKITTKWPEVTIFAPHSPLRLSEEGNTILRDSGGKTLVDAHRDDLLRSIRAQRPETPYNIQESSVAALRALPATDFAPLKNYAYERALDLTILVKAASLYLRDLALQELQPKKN